MPVNGSDVKVVYYTRSAYNNLSTKDDNTIYYVQETNGRLSLYIGNRSMGYATESYVDTKVAPKLDSNPAIVGGTSPKITYDSKGLVTGGSSLVAADIPNLPASKTTSGTFNVARIPQLAGSKITQSSTYRFVTDTEKSTWNDKQDKLVAGDNITIDENTNVISASGGGGEGRVKLLRARSGTTALTIHSDTSVTGVGSQLQRGDTIMFEVSQVATITTSTPKILTVTVSSTANSASNTRSVTFTTWIGTVMEVYSLSVARSTSGALTFGNMNVMTMIKSGTDVDITNGTWTAYIGRIWKVDGDVI